MTGSKRDSRAVPARGQGATIPTLARAMHASSRVKCTQILPVPHKDNQFWIDWHFACAVAHCNWYMKQVQMFVV